MQSVLREDLLLTCVSLCSLVWRTAPMHLPLWTRLTLWSKRLNVRPEEPSLGQPYDCVAKTNCTYAQVMKIRAICRFCFHVVTVV